MIRLRALLVLTLALSMQGRVSAQFNHAISVFTTDTVFLNAGISICFRNASTSELVAGYNENMALGSASVMKLVTTAAALETLGPEFRFTTMVGYTGTINKADSILDGYIVIKGGGDPTLLSEYFPDHNIDIINEWADALSHASIKSVKGSVLSDAMVFDYHPAPGGWNWADLGNYYGAGVHGIAIFDNMYRIHFKTGGEGSVPEITAIDPEVPGLIIENRLISNGIVDNGYVYLEPYGNHAIIRGEIPAGKDDFILKASIPDPPLLAASLLQEALVIRGLDFGKQSTTLRLSPSLSEEYRFSPKIVVHTSFSPPLSEIISATNRESLNLYAEQLLKYMGVLYTGNEKATSGEGLKAVKEYFDNRLGDTRGLYMTDGSGLSRSNAISSAFITRLLCYMKNESIYGGYFVNSLPEAGKEGTLKYYFKDQAFEGRLAAKSGTSTRIRNYAGYIKTLGGKEYSFAVLVNNFDCTPSEVTVKIESLLKEIIMAE